MNITVLQSSNWGDSFTTAYTLNASSLMINGADQIAGGVAIGSASSPVDFMFTSFNYAQRASDYSGKWRVFVVKE